MLKEIPEKVKMGLGRLLGGTTRKDKNVVQTWKDLCQSRDTKPTERLLQLMKFDLREGGVNLEEVEKAAVDEEVQEIEEEGKKAAGLVSVVDEFKEMLIREKIQHAKDVAAASNQDIQGINIRQREQQEEAEEKAKKPFG